MMNAVYCVTRKDLPAIHQAVQSGHAVLKAGSIWPDQDYNKCYLIYLHAEDKDDMAEIFKGLQEEGIEFTSFYEPDFNRGLTSFATQPIKLNSSETLSKLDLMEI